MTLLHCSHCFKKWLIDFIQYPQWRVLKCDGCGSQEIDIVQEWQAREADEGMGV